MESEPTLKDILAAVKEAGEAIQALATHMDQRFTQVDGRFTQVDQRFTQVDGRFAESEHRMMDFVDRRVGQAETRLERKIGTLVDVLQKKDVITPQEATNVVRA